MIEAPILRRAPVALAFFDALRLGTRYEVGTTAISRDAALDFARAFDPLGIHVDEEKAAESIFGRIIVSGYHTVAAVHALMIRGGFIDEARVVCGLRVDELRFIRPVIPGDVLTVTAEIIQLKPPRRIGDFGIACIRYQVVNQDGVMVMSFVDNHVLKLAPPTSPQQAVAT